jgi:hypothetical protein
MKFIVFLAAPHMEEMPFLQSCEAMEYALAATHSEVSLLFGRQTESGTNLGLCRLKNDRTDGFTRKILARFMNPVKSAFFNTLSEIKRLSSLGVRLKLRNWLPLLTSVLLYLRSHHP